MGEDETAALTPEARLLRQIIEGLSNVLIRCPGGADASDDNDTTELQVNHIKIFSLYLSNIYYLLLTLVFFLYLCVQHALRSLAAVAPLCTCIRSCAAVSEEDFSPSALLSRRHSGSFSSPQRYVAFILFMIEYD